jgi:hypothetical protein
MIRFTIEVSIIKLRTILLNFLFALENQSFNLCLVILLFLKCQTTFAILLCLVEFLPGVFTVWQKYLSECQTWNKKVICLWCHPANVIVWPLKVASKASEENIQQLQV